MLLVPAFLLAAGLLMSEPWRSAPGVMPAPVLLVVLVILVVSPVIETLFLRWFKRTNVLRFRNDHEAVAYLMFLWSAVECSVWVMPAVAGFLALMWSAPLWIAAIGFSSSWTGMALVFPTQRKWVAQLESWGLVGSVPSIIPG